MTLCIYYVYIWETITEIKITILFYYFKSVADLIDFLD